MSDADIDTQARDLVLRLDGCDVTRLESDRDAGEVNLFIEPDADAQRNGTTDAVARIEEIVDLGALVDIRDAVGDVDENDSQEGGG